MLISLKILLILALIVRSSNPMAILKQFQHSLQLITRQNDGDLFTLESSECNLDTCIGFSSGTATLYRSPNNNFKNTCTCQCLGHLSTFRDDLHICVDDIHECTLSPFVSGSISHHIPLVILPLKGQIVHPSKEVSLPGIKTPICSVNGAQFLSENGWLHLRNAFGTNVPFQLFRDEGRTFLQWLGENELRSKMTGRVILVHLMCKDLSADDLSILSNVENYAPLFFFNSCVAFRVVGSPSKYLSNITEVTFSSESNKVLENNRLNLFEYLAIISCAVILGLIYIVTVFLYLYIKRRKEINNKPIIEPYDKETHDNDIRYYKSGPSPISSRDLFLKRDYYHSQSNHHTIYKPKQRQKPQPDTDPSRFLEDDSLFESLSENSSVKKPTNNQLKTSAQVHSSNTNIDEGFLCRRNRSIKNTLFRQQETKECLPEEDLAIVESLDERESQSPDTVKSIVNNNQNMRQKLYFNPSYFEPHLLLAPPPAAVEFVTKIREVINVARQKITAKRFVPSLNEIPEENYIQSTDTSNSRKTTPNSTILQQAPLNQNEKQDNIKKWLENIAVSNQCNNPVNSQKSTLNYESDSLERKLNNSNVIVNFKLCAKNKIRHENYQIDTITKSTKQTDYSLVSEVYVNNGFSDANSDDISVMSSTSDPILTDIVSGSSTNNSGAETITTEHLGCLKIEIEDCPDHYLPSEDQNSDCFEPDTLEKKSFKLTSIDTNNNIDDEYMDSLERPSNNSFVRKAGSLREIYEARVRANSDPLLGNGEDFVRILSLEERHSRRQRKSTLEQKFNLKTAPDLIPKEEHKQYGIYQSPKSTKQLINERISSIRRTKNGLSGSTYPLSSGEKKPSSSNCISVHHHPCTTRLTIGTSATTKLHSLSLDTLKRIVNIEPDFKHRLLVDRKLSMGGKYEDSGYLSTDSNESPPNRLQTVQSIQKVLPDDDLAISETDESFGDGHSESGAESIETHSVFFNLYHGHDNNDYFAQNNLTIKKVKDSSVLVNN